MRQNRLIFIVRLVFIFKYLPAGMEVIVLCTLYRLLISLQVFNYFNMNPFVIGPVRYL